MISKLVTTMVLNRPMRLIKISDLSMHEFEGVNIPNYAILSHRWEEEEVTLKDFKKKRNLHLSGWKKIEGFRKFLASNCLADWFWVDTCCIDKSSSAELSEAINSMYSAES